MKSQFVVCESADGWSLHRKGATDEEIANGDAPPLACGVWIDDDDHEIPEWAWIEAEMA